MIDYIMNMNAGVLFIVVGVGSFLLSIPVWYAYCDFRKWLKRLYSERYSRFQDTL